MIKIEPYGVRQIVVDYESVVKGMDNRARKLQEAGERSYGGYLRAKKGTLVERLATNMILQGWKALGGHPNRIDIDSKKIRVPIRPDYLERLDDDQVRKHLQANLDDYYYDISVDRHVKVDDDLVMVVECKSYAENAMFKRILLDFDLLAEYGPDDLVFVLFQLESQLGGDYSELNEVTLGSSSTHTLISHFDNKVEIMTLLKGERRVKKPIHKEQFYKPLDFAVVERYVRRFAELLGPHV